MKWRKVVQGISLEEQYKSEELQRGINFICAWLGLMVIFKLQTHTEQSKLYIKCQTAQSSKKQQPMADRQKFCVTIMSLLVLLSAVYLAYYLFLSPDRALMDKYNHIRFCIFFGQHFVVLAMLFMLLRSNEEPDLAIRWMFQLSAAVMMMFVGGEVFVVARGGRLFGTRVVHMTDGTDDHEGIVQFEINQITLYFQILTDFALFFIISGVALIVLKCRDVDTEERYEFMIENLKSEEFVDEPNAQEKKGCAICLTDLEAERVLKLPCGHVFHKECLVNWLKRSSVCPMCRNDIQQSLSPASPQRYPPIRSQPILLLPPSPVNDVPLSNPLIQPRQVISLNRNRGQVRPNQNQRTGNRLGIFEQVGRSNKNRLDERFMERRNVFVPMVGREMQLGEEREMVREDVRNQARQVQISRQQDKKKSVVQNLGAMTQRKDQMSNLKMHMCDPSSPFLQPPQSPRQQEHLIRQQIPIAVLKLTCLQKQQKKQQYQNPNENCQNDQGRQNKTREEVWRNRAAEFVQ